MREDSNFVPTHLFLDGLSALAVLASSWLSHSPSWTWIDFAGAGLTVLMLCVNEAWPVTYETGRLLLQTTPVTLRDALDRCIRGA